MWNPDSYLKAWEFACNAHLEQKIPGSEIPYINHIAAVAMEVMTAIAQHPIQEADLAIQAALLHDTLEDTKITYKDILDNFGQAVAEGVLALTKNMELAKPEQMQDSLNRILLQPKAIWMVKLADRIDNLQAPPYYWTTEKMQKYQKEALLIYNTLGQANDILAKRLLTKIENYKVYFKD